MYFSSKYNFDNMKAYYVLCCACIITYCMWGCVCMCVCICVIAETLVLGMIYY